MTDIGLNFNMRALVEFMNSLALMTGGEARVDGDYYWAFDPEVAFRGPHGYGDAGWWGGIKTAPAALVISWPSDISLRDEVDIGHGIRRVQTRRAE